MKTYKNLYKKLCLWDNIFLAFEKARKGKTREYCVQKFEKNLKENLLEIQNKLKSQTYSPFPLKKFIIRDPKTRTIFKSAFKDRIVHHVIVNILEPIFEPIFIYDSYASRKNKGHHKALKRFDYFGRKVSKNNTRTCYVLKADIKHYFQTIDQGILLNIIREKIQDEKVICLIRKILENHNSEQIYKGMPLGNYTSQFFANVYLNELDYFVKHNLKVKYYIRYVDDFVILCESRSQLEIWKQEINEFLRERLRLELHIEKSRVMSLYNGIPLLGFRIFYYYKLLKKGSINQIKRNIKEWTKLLEEEEISQNKIIQRLQGWLAHAKHGDNYNLSNKLISIINFSNSFSKHLLKENSLEINEKEADY